MYVFYFLITRQKQKKIPEPIVKACDYYCDRYNLLLKGLFLEFIDPGIFLANKQPGSRNCRFKFNIFELNFKFKFKLNFKFKFKFNLNIVLISRKSNTEE